jgi:hypothetical protein
MMSKGIIKRIVAVSVRALTGSEVLGRSPETVAARRAAPSNR